MPSFINEWLLGEAKDFTAQAGSIILLDASRLKAEETLKFRSDLRKIGAKLRVSKASIIGRALGPELAKGLDLAGPVGLIAGEDIAAAAKLVNDLVKEEKVRLRGAILDGRALTAKEAGRLADLPSKEQARVLLVRTLNAPLVQLVRILNVKPTELVRVLKVKADEAAK